MPKLTPDHYGYVEVNGVRRKFQPGPDGTVNIPEPGTMDGRGEYNLKEALKDDDADPGDLEPLRDHPRFADVTKVRKFEGYYIARLNPYGHWAALKRTSGQPIPQELQGSFTVLDSAQKAILKYLGRME